MQSRMLAIVVVLGGSLAACGSDLSVVPASEELPAAEGANDVLPWAFVLNDPVPADAETPDPNERVTVPGSPLTIRRAEINIDSGPPDWHPDSHPPMPEIVAKGGGEGALACGYCHLPNGQGKPENAGLAGQPYAYLVQQMEDYRNGRRRTGDTRMGPPTLMMGIGAAATAAEARIAAEYFSSIEFKPWIRVVETDSVPVTRFAGWIHEVIEDGGMEPIGTRVVEVPEDLGRTKLRDDASGFVAYVPEGAVARGAALVTTAGDGRTASCTACHGPDLRGLGPVPALAGRSPSYMARQLYDLKQGNRDGLWSDLMNEAVANLTVQDVVDIVAYAASLEP
ncbi:MAG: c-type cytochrome [Gemmatimonadota bacterium]